jgi:hypothetical protein
MGGESSCRLCSYSTAGLRWLYGLARRPLHGNQSWDDNPEFFGLKFARDWAKVFLMHISFTVLPPDFLNSSGKNTHYIGGDFHHFDSFVFNSYYDTICLSY